MEFLFLKKQSNYMPQLVWPLLLEETSIPSFSSFFLLGILRGELNGEGKTIQ